MRTSTFGLLEVLYIDTTSYLKLRQRHIHKVVEGSVIHQLSYRKILEVLKYQETKYKKLLAISCQVQYFQILHLIGQWD